MYLNNALDLSNKIYIPEYLAYIILQAKERIEHYYEHIQKNRNDIDDAHIWGNTNDSNNKQRSQTDRFAFARDDDK